MTGMLAREQYLLPKSVAELLVHSNLHCMPTVLFFSTSFYPAPKVKVLWSFQWHANSENARNTCDKSKIFDFYNSKDINTTNMIKPDCDFQKGCSIKIIWVPIFLIIARETGMETIDLFTLSLKDEFRWIIKKTDGHLSELLKKIRFTALSLTVCSLCGCMSKWIPMARTITKKQALSTNWGS